MWLNVEERSGDVWRQIIHSYVVTAEGPAGRLYFPERHINQLFCLKIGLTGTEARRNRYALLKVLSDG